MQASCPKRVVFVLKETQPERGISNGGDCYAYLKPPGVSEVQEKVLGIEGSDCAWSLIDRLQLANELLDAADAAGTGAGVGVMYVIVLACSFGA